jgi:hypothetical protein
MKYSSSVTYDIIFFGIIILLIILYVIYSQKETCVIELANDPDYDYEYYDYDDEFNAKVNNDINEQNMKLQEDADVLSLKGDDYKQIDEENRKEKYVLY